MKVATALNRLVRANPSEAEIHRVLHTESSVNLRKIVSNVEVGVSRCYHSNPDIQALQEQLIRRTAKVAQQILDNRVCVAS
jgi:hypothetical protein